MRNQPPRKKPRMNTTMKDVMARMLSGTIGRRWLFSTSGLASANQGGLRVRGGRSGYLGGRGRDGDGRLGVPRIWKCGPHCDH